MITNSSKMLMLRAKLERVEAENAELKTAMETMTARFTRLADGVYEVEKKNDSELPVGDYLNPIAWEAGMRVAENLFYFSKDKDTPLMAIRSGYPSEFGDEYFEQFPAN